MNESDFSTGEDARLLDTTEPRLAELDRRGKIHPRPRVVAGRRVWDRDHIPQAARLLGRDVEAVLSQLEEVPRG